tara:strand:- start:220 stop:948 length:729 start_codon:yes stop_codon:yes gene_type:complete
MKYFNDFPNSFYKFGDEVSPVIFQNISLYSDVVDQVKDGISFLNFHTIQEGFRPDQVSIQLYGSPFFYWTFYLLNDDLREQGWPLPNHELINYLKKILPNTVINTVDEFATKFKVGQTVTGGSSGLSGKIIKRDLDLGKITIEGNVAFRTGGELFTTTNADGNLETLTGTSTVKEFQSTSHYVDGTGTIVDIDPQSGPGALLTEKTFEDVYFTVNESLRQIKVIKPSQINNIVTSYKKSIRS